MKFKCSFSLRAVNEAHLHQELRFKILSICWDLKSCWFNSSSVKIQKENPSRNIQRQLLQKYDRNITEILQKYYRNITEIFRDSYLSNLHSAALLWYKSLPFIIRYLAWLNINSVYYTQLAEKSGTWIIYSWKGKRNKEFDTSAEAVLSSFQQKWSHFKARCFGIKERLINVA